MLTPLSVTDILNCKGGGGGDLSKPSLPPLYIGNRCMYFYCSRLWLKMMSRLSVTDILNLKRGRGGRFV